MDVEPIRLYIINTSIQSMDNDNLELSIDIDKTNELPKVEPKMLNVINTLFQSTGNSINEVSTIRKKQWD